MPLYEYKCSSCGDVFEVIQKFSDEPLKVHATCGGTVERLISTSALQFKGSGWYVNDYGKGNSKQPGSKQDAANGKTDNKTEKSNGSSTASESSGKSETSTKTESSSPAPSAPSASKSDGK